MNEIQIFNNPTFGDIRTILINDEPWFVGKDVAKALGYSNTNDALSNHVDEEDRIMGSPNATPSIIDNLGREQYPTFINESGLYSLVFSSKNQDAKTFKHWVTSEVLPSIRKHGAYMTESTIDDIINNPEFGIKLLMELKNEQDKRKALEIENAQQKQLLLEAQPKLNYVDQILKSKNAINITQIAKDYSMAGAKMNNLLHDLGIQYKQHGQWLLYSKYANQGYTKSKTGYYVDENDQAYSYIHTKWTQKGRLFLYEQLKSIGVLPLIEQ